MICRECMYWSEYIADADRNGLKAKCLHPGSHHAGHMMRAHHGCMWGEAGEPIDVDTPPDTAEGRDDGG